jgi:hypothetical protein
VLNMLCYSSSPYFLLFMKRDISDENRIHWSTKNLPTWVREVTADLSGRNGMTREDYNRLQQNGWFVYGYAELTQHAIASCQGDDGLDRFDRRVFYRIIEGEDSYDEGRCPVEAVAPESIKPGVWGLSPYREPRLGVRISTELFWELNAYTQLGRLSLTEVVSRALSEFMGLSAKQGSRPVNGGSLQNRVMSIEERLDLIEQQIELIGRA